MECADAVFGDENVVLFGANSRMNLAQCALKHLLIFPGTLDGAKQNVARANLRKPWPESHLNMNDAHAQAPSARQDACRARQECLRFLPVGRNDAALKVHTQNSCSRSVKR